MKKKGMSSPNIPKEEILGIASGKIKLLFCQGLFFHQR